VVREDMFFLQDISTMVSGFKEKCMELALLRKDMIKSKVSGLKAKKWLEHEI